MVAVVQLVKSVKKIKKIETMKQKIYLDHSATTCMDQEVKKAMDFEKCFGNPNSFHSFGLEAAEALNKARVKVQGLLNATNEKEIVFTSGGTESVNLAIQGIARGSKKKEIITSKTEHHAVLHTCEFMEKIGYKVKYLDVDAYGRVNPDVLDKAITKDTLLVSIMYANNEIGTINDISSLSKVCKKHKVFFHTDACQASSQNLDVKKLGVDLLTLNGSKMYGPKGTGLLYVKNSVNIKPLMFGGSQEYGLRPGTENVPGIIGLAKALEITQKNKDKENKKLIKLRDKMIKFLLEKVPKTVLNGHPVYRLPNNVNISFLDIEGESILLHLDSKGIAASSGSACTSKSLDPSHVIVATGMPYEIAHGSIRFTLGRKTTEEEVDKVLGVLPGIVESLRKISPFKLDFDEVTKDLPDDLKGKLK